MSVKFEDQKISIRIKLAAMWASVMFLYIYGDYFELYVPGKTEGLVNGGNMLNTPLKLFLATFILSLPALMIFLSLVLSKSIARWLNIILGIFLTLFTLLVGASSISYWTTFYVYLALLESIITAAIAIKAWRWEKQEAK